MRCCTRRRGPGTGFAAARSLPRWRRDTVRREAPGYGLAGAAQALAAEKAVVLWVDTFNGHFETENARDAVRVLRAAGYSVHVPGLSGEPLCCGRTYLATGMAGRAKARAGALVAALQPFAERGIAIVGLEPSCLLTLRDKLIAHLPRYAGWASAPPWLFNLRDRIPGLARWSERATGLAPARPLGFYIVAGFSGHGFMHGPIAGQLIAEMILDGQAASLDIHPLRLSRFAESDLVREHNVV